MKYDDSHNYDSSRLVVFGPWMVWVVWNVSGGEQRSLLDGVSLTRVDTTEINQSWQGCSQKKNPGRSIFVHMYVLKCMYFCT